MSHLRSLGGGELHGDKLVRLVYVDEAGIGNPKHEPFVVVAGVIVDADRKLSQLRAALNAVIDRHIPPEARDGFVLHATEIFNGGGKLFGRGTSESWSIARRLAIAVDLAKIPAEIGLPLAFGWVDRELFAGTFEPGENPSRHERTKDEHVVSYLRCAQVIDRWMRDRTDEENCMLIVENNESARSLILEVHRVFQDEKALNLLPHEWEFLPLRRIQEDPLFQPKRSSSPLQMADFCAYVYKRILMNPTDERFVPFWEPMRAMASHFDREAGLQVIS
jgi:hypothetical protein